MRTDAKVGLICALALAIAVVAYFALHNQPTPTVAKATGETSVALATTTPPSDAPTRSTVVVAPPSAVAPSSDTSLVPPGGGPATPAPTPITPPTTRTLLPSTMPAAPSSTGGLTGGTPTPPPTTMSSSAGRGTEIPTSDRPDSSMLERSSTPHATIGDSSSSGSSLTGSATTYKIQSGDTFSSLAKKFNTTVKAIQAANPKADSSHLKINQPINIPAPGSSSSSSSSSTSGTSSTSTGSGATTKPHHTPATIGTTPGSTPSTPAAPGTSYIVKKGDTLRKIAKSVYGDEKASRKIYNANKAAIGDDPDDLDLGLKLNLPAK